MPLLDAALHYSFPSGHTFTSITFFGFLVYFTVTYLSNKLLKILIVFVLIVLIICIGWSRIYLNVHYASDVFAGASLGILWMIMADWFLLGKNNKFRLRHPGKTR